MPSYIKYKTKINPRLIILMMCFNMIGLFTVAQTPEEYDEEDAVVVQSDTVLKPFDILSSWSSSDPEIRKVPDSAVTELQNQDVFWYANEDWVKPPRRQEKKRTFTDAGWFKSLMWLIIIGSFVAAIVWYLATSNFSFFSRKPAMVKEKDDEPEMENIFEIRYEKEIKKAIEAGNFRLATRLHFLQLLKQMSEQNIIRYKQDRTNFDYLMQIHNSTYYNDFFRITRNYEFAWYGKRDPGEEGFKIIQKDFERFQIKLRHS